MSEEQAKRMEAALNNILDISSDEFSRSQARYGLGIEAIEMEEGDTHE